MESGRDPGYYPPPHTPHTHTPLSLFFFFFFYYYLPLFVYVVMYIFFREGIIIAALRADWALRLVSERPADYVRLRAETKPAQPLNFTAFGSYSRSSAHFQARCLTTNLRERERARVWQKKNHLILLRLQQTDCGTSLSPLWIFFYVCASRMCFFPYCLAQVWQSCYWT